MSITKGYWFWVGFAAGWFVAALLWAPDPWGPL